MSEHSSNSKKPDRSRVTVGSQSEIDYWADRLHCTESELKNAVHVVGSSVDEVRMFLHN